MKTITLTDDAHQALVDLVQTTLSMQEMVINLLASRFGMDSVEVAGEIEKTLDLELAEQQLTG